MLCPFFILTLQTPINPHVSSEEVGKYAYQRQWRVSWEMKEISSPCLVIHLGLRSANYSIDAIFSVHPKALPELLSGRQPLRKPLLNHRVVPDALPRGALPRARRQALPPELSTTAPSRKASYEGEQVTNLQQTEIPPVGILIQTGAHLPQKTVLPWGGGDWTRGRESFGPVKQSQRGSCCPLRGKLFLGCLSRQSLLFCRPKAFFSSVRCCYHLQSHIKTVFVLRFDFPHTENSKSTGLFERERGSISDALCVFVFPCLWVG